MFSFICGAILAATLAPLPRRLNKKQRYKQWEALIETQSHRVETPSGDSPPKWLDLCDYAIAQSHDALFQHILCRHLNGHGDLERFVKHLSSDIDRLSIGGP